MRSALLIAMLLVVIMPASVAADTAARSVSVSPAEVTIDNLSPGEPVDFELTIRNDEGQDRVFVLTIHHPPEEARRAGRDRLPDDSWISFSTEEFEVGADCEAGVRVTVSVPREQAFMGRNWEVWLGVTPQSGELVVVKYYVRLLVSTRPEAKARFGTWMVAAIIVAAVMLGCGAHYHLRRRAEHG